MPRRWRQRPHDALPQRLLRFRAAPFVLSPGSRNPNVFAGVEVLKGVARFPPSLVPRLPAIPEADTVTMARITANGARGTRCIDCPEKLREIA